MKLTKKAAMEIRNMEDWKNMNYLQNQELPTVANITSVAQAEEEAEEEYKADMAEWKEKIADLKKKITATIAARSKLKTQRAIKNNKEKTEQLSHELLTLQQSPPVYYDEPIQYLEKPMVDAHYLIVENKTNHWGAFEFSTIDYQLHWKENLHDIQEDFQSVNPDIVFQNAYGLYDSGCDSEGYRWDKRDWDKSSHMIDRTTQDLCVTMNHYRGGKVPARLTLKIEDKVSKWLTEPYWMEILPEIELDLIHHFIKALKELNFDYKMTRQLVEGHHIVDKKQLKTKVKQKIRHIDGLKEMTVKKQRQMILNIIDAAKIDNWEELKAKDAFMRNTSNLPIEAIGLNSYGLNSDNISHSTRPVHYDWTPEDDEILDYDEMLDTDGLQIATGATDFTAVPMEHPNHYVPYYVFKEITECNYETLKQWMKQLIEKKAYYEFNAQWSDSQITQLWDLINYRKVKLGYPPLKSKIDLYEQLPSGKWILKEQLKEFKKTIPKVIIRRRKAA